MYLPPTPEGISRMQVYLKEKGLLESDIGRQLRKAGSQSAQ